MTGSRFMCFFPFFQYSTLALERSHETSAVASRHRLDISAWRQGNGASVTLCRSLNAPPAAPAWPARRSATTRSQRFGVGVRRRAFPSRPILLSQSPPGDGHQDDRR
jgi:hypothetical protein